MSVSHHLPKFEIDAFDEKFYAFCATAVGADICKFWNTLFQLKNCTVNAPFEWIKYLQNSVPHFTSILLIQNLHSINL